MTFAAVVVTYNRKTLLEECIRSLLLQEQKLDAIYVINNASTDGTDKFFETGGIFSNVGSIRHIKLEKNLGGAGGFNYGIRQAYQDGFEWIWVMDDDTIPTESALLAFKNAIDFLPPKVGFLASNVRSIEDTPMNIPIVKLDNHADSGYPDWSEFLAKGAVKIEQATFVSVLINRDAVAAVGLPYTPFFIWGDDTEYTLRITHHFGDGYLIGDSVAIHKRATIKDIDIQHETNKNRIGMYYCLYRNYLVSCYAYHGGSKQVFRYIFRFNKKAFRLLVKPGVQFRLKKFIAIQKGIFGYLFGKYNRKEFRKRFTI